MWPFRRQLSQMVYMMDELENIMEQHDRLYRSAYKKYLNNDLLAAHRIATEALDIAQQFRRQNDGLAEPQRFSCRAKTLLEAIEWRSLLDQDK
jgi:hypothetical protein